MSDISMSLLGATGLCTAGKKCVKKDGHDGECWPEDDD